MTCDEEKPWQNPIFGDLIWAQWWGPKGDAKRLGLSEDNIYLNVPFAMLALVACAVSAPYLCFNYDLTAGCLNFQVDCTLTSLPIQHNLDFNDVQYRMK